MEKKKNPHTHTVLLLLSFFF
uniref:Uncharacterized protein n=1 Tax=Rhizophora mucronata TaxID=61149 RepID=A0A2P2QRX4_RHIMU